MTHIAQAGLLQEIPASALELPAEYREKRWYAAYTCPHHEKYASAQMRNQEIECFLPLYQSMRRWKDRRKQLELPLFPGYVFVHIALRDRLRVLRLPGVVQLVSFRGVPAVLCESEIELLRNSMSRSDVFHPHPYLKVGKRVRVHNGPMAGLEGVLVRRKDTFRVVLSVDLIMRSIALEVDLADVAPLR
jgi:transcription antitermination factor NusG